MKLIVSCNSPYSKGGLGQHFAQIVEEAQLQGTHIKYICTGSLPDQSSLPDSSSGSIVDLSDLRPIINYSPLRFNQEWRTFVVNVIFDLRVRAKLNMAPDTFAGFAGQSLYTMRHARHMGVRQLILHSPTAHIAKVKIQYARAAENHAIEGCWLGRALVKKTLLEYEEADLIVVNSEYARRSFIEFGVPESKLTTVELKPHSRFRPNKARRSDGKFRIVYVGGLTQTKGLPVLLHAFSSFSAHDAELTLVGGWASRPMRKYIQKCISLDARIRLKPGDPLPHLQGADVYVHPSYQDGFGYAPMEALACGVPVIVSEDTGMKEKVHEGVNGFVVPTGNSRAICESLQRLYSLPTKRVESDL